MGDRHGPRSFEEQVIRVRKATVLLARGRMLTTAQGRHFQITQAVGSGFFISPDGWLMTSKHVVNPIGNPLGPGEGILAFSKTSETSGRFTTSATISHDFPQLDVSLIKFDESFGCLPLSPRLPVQGEEIGIFGYPSSDLRINGSSFVPDTITPRVAKTIIGSIESVTKQFDAGTPGAFTIASKRFIESWTAPLNLDRLT